MKPLLLFSVAASGLSLGAGLAVGASGPPSDPGTGAGHAVSPSGPTALVAPPTAVPTHRSQRTRHVPSVRGLSVTAAQRRIADAGFTNEPGTRYAPVRRTATTVTVARSSGRDDRVRVQTPVSSSFVASGEVVALGTARPSLPGRRIFGLEELRWGTVRIARGRLILDRVAGSDDCLTFDHVQVGPAGGATRSVRIWTLNQSFPRRAACERPPRRVVVPLPRGWKRSTVVWNDALAVPDPGRVQAKRTPFSAVALQSDRRSLVVSYREGGCEALAAASARRSGRRITIDLRLGVPPLPPGEPERGCTRDMRVRSTLLRLPHAAPAGVRFVAAR